MRRQPATRDSSAASAYALGAFLAEFPTDEACLTWLWRTRSARDGIHARCPTCGRLTEFARYATAPPRRSWTCTACGHHLHPTAGTIFHKSSTSLHQWFYAIYLLTSTGGRFSAKQLERELGVTYKTAWRLTHLIRLTLRTQGHRGS